MIPAALSSVVCDFASLASLAQVEAVAQRLRDQLPGTKGASALSLMTTPAGRLALGQVLSEWAPTDVSGPELAALLVGSARAMQASERSEQLELVWTGPVSRFVPLRRSDRVLIELIDGARARIGLVSFVAYDVPEVVSALERAVRRGVSVRLLLESTRFDTTLSYDPIDAMRPLIPGAELLTWVRREGEFEGGRVHAKFAVVDGRAAFLTSANLTGNAYAKNMEAGIVVRGGPLPKRLEEHLDALVDAGLVAAPWSL